MIKEQLRKDYVVEIRCRWREVRMDMDIQYIQEQLAAVWPEWRVERRLGRGSYGAVYEIVRDDLGSVNKCALKVLQMSASVGDDQSLGQGSNRTAEVAAGFAGTRPVFEKGGDHYGGYGGRDETIEDFVRSVSSEIDVMIRLKGTPGVVTIEDYTVLRSATGCMILIRMEELEGLESYIRRTGILPQEQVVRLGTDLCTALDFCEQSGILHRDIKPGNIFYSDRAGFKLGDFGISRRMESIYERRAMSRVGTVQYMAPETYFGDAYGNTADLYSLGLVLYTLLNGNAPPFCEQEAVSGRAGSAWNGGGIENTGVARAPHSANMRRLKGEELPPPSLARKRLAAVVCRACDPVPEKRYQSAREFRQALQECLLPEKGGFGKTPAGGGRVKSDTGKKHTGKTGQGGSSQGGLRRPAVIGIAAACAAVVLFLLFGRENGSGAGNSGSASASGGQQTLSQAQAADDVDTETEPARVSYEIRYVDQEDGNELAEASEGTGTAGSRISQNAVSIEGYTPVESSGTLTLSENASENVLVFEYVRTPASVVYNTKGRVHILCKKYDQNLMQQLIDRFTKESGIQVTAEVRGTGSYSDRLKENVTGSSSDPTLFMLTGYKDLEKYGAYCADMTDSAAAQEVDDPSLLLRGSNGMVYGLPCLVESYGLAVNLELLEQMGIDPADIDSFDSLERIAELVTDEKDDLGFAAFSSPSVGVGVSGSYRFSEHGPVVPLYYELRDSDFNVGTALSGSYMDQYRNYVDLYINHSVVSAEDSVGRTLEDAQREFMEGKALFHQDGSWSAEKLEEALADKYAVIPLYMGMPGEEDQGLNETCSYYWCVNKYASEDDREAALQFLQWLTTSDEALRIQADEMDFAVPYKRARIPDNPFLEELYKEKQEGRTPVRQYYKYGRYTDWVNAMDHAIEDYVKGSGSWDNVRKAFTTLF